MKPKPDTYAPFNMGGFGLIGYVPNTLYKIILYILECFFLPFLNVLLLCVVCCVYIYGVIVNDFQVYISWCTELTKMCQGIGRPPRPSIMEAFGERYKEFFD
jgi:hypothetical protein